MENSSDPYILLGSKDKRNVIAGSALLWFNNLIITCVTPITLVALMEYYDSMKYFAILNGTGSLVFCITTLLGGKLGDRFGRRKVCLTAGYVRTALLLLCAVPSAVTLFSVLYILVYALGGFLNAFPATILSDVTSAGERPRWFGVFGTVNGLALVLGLLFGGVIVDTLGPFVIFLIYALLGLAALFPLTRSYPNREADAGSRLDRSGLILLSLGLSCVFFWSSLGDVIVPRFSFTGISILAAGLALLTVFWMHERKAATPVLDVKLFRDTHFTISFLTHMMIAPMVCICNTVLVLYGEISLGLSATVSGTLAMPKNLLLLLLPPFLGHWLVKDHRRYRISFLLCGISIACAGLVSSSWNTATPVWAVYLGMLIYGLGTSFQSVSIQPYMQMTMPASHMGMAVAMVQFANSIGSVFSNAFYNAFYNMKYASAMARGGEAFLPQAVTEVMMSVSLLTAASGIMIVLSALLLIPSKKRECGSRRMMITRL